MLNCISIAQKYRVGRMKSESERMKKKKKEKRNVNQVHFQRPEAEK